MKICLPNRYYECIKYPKKNAKYYTGKERIDIRNLLREASDTYCMYCGTSLLHDGSLNMQLEHSVDKEGNEGEAEKEKVLKECKFNLAAACEQCNMVYKKRVEKMDLRNYNLPLECPVECKLPCEGYESIREAYCKINSIILQPEGFCSDGIAYAVRYNILRDLYEPDIDDADDIHKFFVERHIRRFHLNRDRLSRNVIDICVDIVDMKEYGLSEDRVRKLLCHFKNRQPNIIGKMFLEFLESKFQDKSVDELIEFCRVIVLSSAII